MPISLACPSCAAKLNAPDTKAGKKTKCPKCGAILQLPGAVPMTASPLVAPAAKAPASSAPATAARPVTDTAVQQTAKPAAPQTKNAGRNVVLLIVTLVAGGVVGLGSLAAVGAWMLWPRAPVASTTGPDPSAVNNAIPSADSSSPQVNALAGAKWIALEDPARIFQAEFPTQHAPYDPLSEIKDPTQRSFAEAVSKRLEGVYVRAADGSRTFSLSATALELSGMPADVYLERMDGAISLMHEGYALKEAKVTQVGEHPARDFLLVGEQGVKVLRIVPTANRLYGLMVQGDKTLSFADAATQEFFRRFTLTGAPAAPRSEAKPTEAPPLVEAATPSEAAPAPMNTAKVEEAPRLPAGSTHTHRGKAFAYTLQLPGESVEYVDFTTLINDPGTQKFITAGSQKEKVVVEALQQEHQGRTISVLALHDADPKAMGNKIFNRQQSRSRILQQDTLRDYQLGVGGSDVRSAAGVEVPIYIATNASGRTLLYSRTIKGPYSCYIRIAGDEPLSIDDPLLRAVLLSFAPPAE